jgi:hypothetical protein
MANRPQPSAGMALTHFIVRSDISRSRHFYVDVLGGEILLDGEPTIVALANSWIIINRGGGPPTDDKPTVTLEPPRDLRVVNAFLNIRAADIYNLYEQWQACGAEFLTRQRTVVSNCAATCAIQTATSSRSGRHSGNAARQADTHTRAT